MDLVRALDVRYDKDAPGIYCISHRSVYCPDVQELVSVRADVGSLSKVIEDAEKHNGEFSITLPIYPQFCIWEALAYRAIDHETFGPIAELVAGADARHKQVVQRIFPGESAADLATSLRENYEASIEDKIEKLRRQPPSAPGQPGLLPPCTSATHSMRYQRLLKEMTNSNLLKDQWEEVRDQTYALMWTFFYHKQCLFCWTKRNMSDAIRVSPDFMVDSSREVDDHADLVPTAADTNRRKAFDSSDPPW